MTKRDAVVNVSIAERPLIILGARSQAPVVDDWVSSIEGVRVTHFVENLDRIRCGNSIGGRPVIWIDDVRDLGETHAAFCALGSPERKDFIEHVEAFGVPFVVPIHPSAIVSSKSSVGTGSIVSPVVVIAAFTEVGRHVFINRGALIGHNAEVGDFVTIGPGANIAGFTRIGPGTLIGMGAMILDQISVGAGSVIAAGSVVTKDVPDNVVVAGSPARIVRRSE